MVTGNHAQGMGDWSICDGSANRDAPRTDKDAQWDKGKRIRGVKLEEEVKRIQEKMDSDSAREREWKSECI